MSALDLIAVLGKAEGPDRSLDLRIARDVLNSEPLGYAAGLRDELLLVDGGRFGPWPRYTGSIDAALALVPEGFRVAVMEWDHEILRAKGPWQAILTPVGGGDSIFAESQGRCDHALTPAIALCIAALKARSST